SSRLREVRRATGYEFTTGHLAQCRGAISTNSGNSCEHAGTRKSQRGSKPQPGIRACGDGTLPSIVRNGWFRSVCRVGTAFSNPRVYGCAAARKIALLDPNSTTLPKYMTAIRSAT